MNKKLKKEIMLHIIDGIRHLRMDTPDIAQAEHNFFEIANHLGISDEDVNKTLKKETTSFKCFRCGEVFAKKFASKVDEKLCKYCEEFDDENGELKEV